MNNDGKTHTVFDLVPDHLRDVLALATQGAREDLTEEAAQRMASMRREDWPASPAAALIRAREMALDAAVLVALAQCNGEWSEDQVRHMHALRLRFRGAEGQAAVLLGMVCGADEKEDNLLHPDGHCTCFGKGTCGFCRHYCTACGVLVTFGSGLCTACEGKASAEAPAEREPPVDPARTTAAPVSSDCLKCGGSGRDWEKEHEEEDRALTVGRAPMIRPPVHGCPRCHGTGKEPGHE